MATYYWVGGSGYWGDSSGNNWSDSSGGPSYGSGDPAVQAALNYQPDPGPLDDVVFDSNSNLTGTACDIYTMSYDPYNNVVQCAALSISGLTQLMRFGGVTIVTAANVTFDSTTILYLNFTTNVLDGIAMTGTSTFTTGGFTGLNTLYVGYTGTFTGVTSGNITINGNLIGFDTTIYFSDYSTFDANGYSLQLGYLSYNPYGMPGITAGLSMSGSTVYWNSPTQSIDLLSNPNGITFTYLGTSFHLAGNSDAMNGWYFAADAVNELYLNTTATQSPIGLQVNSCNILDIRAPSVPGVIDVYGSITVTGQLITSYTAGNRRVGFGLDGIGGLSISPAYYFPDKKMSLVMNAGATATISDLDFMYGTLSGQASFPLTGTRIGNFGIANLTPSTPKTVYLNNSTSAYSVHFTDDVWALTNGGATNPNNFPLVQDTAIITDTNIPAVIDTQYNSSNSYPFYLTYSGGFDCSAVTSSITLNMNGFSFFGDVKFSNTSVVYGPIYLFGSGVLLINGADLTYLSSLFIYRSLTLNSDLDLTGSPVVFGTYTSQPTGNTLNLNGYSLITSYFTLVTNYTSVPSTVAFGSSTSQIIIAAPSGYGVGLQLGYGNIFTGTTKILYNSNSGNTSTYITADNGYNDLPYCDVTYSGTSGIILSSTVTDIIFQNAYALDFDLTGYTGTISQLTIYVSGNFSIPSGSLSAGYSSIYFIDKGGTKTINTNGNTIYSIAFGTEGTINSTTWVLLNPLTSSNSLTIRSGILNLNGNDITTDSFYTYHDYQAVPSVRQIQFGTNKINFTTRLAIQTQPNEISYTGTLKFVSTGAAVGARYIVGGAIGSSYLDVTTSGSSGIILGTTSPDITYLIGKVVNVDLTGLLNNVRCDYSLGSDINTLQVAGNSIFPASRQVIGGAIYFTNSSTITTNGCLFKNSIFINPGAGSTVALTDDLTNGNDPNNGFINITGGNFNTNNHSIFMYGISIGTGSTAKTLNMGSSIITLTGAGPVIVQGGATNFTITKTTGYINLTSASAKTFTGGGFSYPKVNIAANGNLTISGSNTFDDLTTTLTTPTANVRFTGGTTQTFNSFNLSGKSGYLIGLTSTNTTKANIKKNTTWYMGANSIDNGNNTNLTFTAGDGIDYLRVSYINGQTNVLPSTGNFFLLF